MEVLLIAARNFCEVCLPSHREREEERKEKRGEDRSEQRTKRKKRQKQKEEEKEVEDDSEDKEKGGDERACFIVSLGKMFSSLAKDPHHYMTELEQEVEEEGGRASDLEQLSVEDITGTCICTCK